MCVMEMLNKLINNIFYFPNLLYFLKLLINLFFGNEMVCSHTTEYLCLNGWLMQIAGCSSRSYSVPPKEGRCLLPKFTGQCRYRRISSLDSRFREGRPKRVIAATGVSDVCVCRYFVQRSDYICQSLFFAWGIFALCLSNMHCKLKLYVNMAYSRP